MSRYVAALSFFVLFAWGYESVTLPASQLFEVVQPAGYWVGEGTSQEMYTRYVEGKFTPLPPIAQSLGYQEAPVWIAIEGIHHALYPQLLSLMNSALEEVTLYVYEEGRLIEVERSGALVPQHLKKYQSYYPSFLLSGQTKPLTYILSIRASSPLFFSFVIARESYVLQMKMREYAVHLLFVGLFVGLFFYNLFLFFSTKESIYGLYTLYIFSLFAWMSATGGYFAVWLQSHLEWQNVLKTATFLTTAFLLQLFTLHFLNIKKHNRPLYWTVVWVSAVGFLLLIGMGQGWVCVETGLMVSTGMVLFNLLVGIFCHFRGCSVAKYYVIASGGFFVGVVILVGMVLGWWAYTRYTHSAMVLGAAWEMLLLAFALGGRIKHLQEERNSALVKAATQEKVLFLQSRYAGVGELIGNITHQWRQPLGEIGSIQTNLKASILLGGGVSREKVLGAIEQSYTILHHLSQTIETFYRFFRYKKEENQAFEIGEQIANIQRMVHYSFETEHIRFICDFDQILHAHGDKNEFAHALLNIVLNAKEALVARAIAKPWVKVNYYATPKAAVIRIEDNAGGITLSPIEQVFVSYVSTKQEGTGIGLYMTKMLVERSMHGRIGVANGPHGAIFTIELPLSQGQKLSALSFTEAIEEVQAKRISTLEQALKERLSLEASLKKWADIFAQARWGIAVYLVREERFELINPAFASLYGYEERTMVRMNLMGLTAPSEQAHLSVEYAILATQGYVTFESLHRHKNGTLFPVHIEVMVAQDTQGEVLYHIINVWDISDQKASDELLKLKRFAINHIHQAVFLSDTVGNIHYVNEATCQMLGYTREEIVGMTLHDIDPDFEAFMQEREGVLNPYNIAPMRRYHRRKDGTLLPVELVGSVLDFQGKQYAITFVEEISERLKTEKEIHQLIAAMDNAGDAIYIADHNRTITYVNEASCRMLGYTKEELVGKPLSFVTADMNDEELKRFRQNYREGQTNFRGRHRHKEGHEIDVEVSVRYFEYEGERIGVTSARDITAQLAQERELKLTFQAMDNAGDAVYIFGEHGVIVKANRAAQEMLGYSEEEIIGHNALLFDHTINEEQLQVMAETSMRDVPVSFDAVHTRKDGTQINVRISSRNFMIGDILFAVSSVRDITAQLAQERALQESFLKYNTLVDHQTDYISRLDLEGRHTFVNKAILRIYGVEESYFLGRTVVETDPHPHSVLLHQKILDTIQTATPQSIEIEYPMPDGGIFVVESRLIPEFDAQGKMVSILGIARDVSKFKRLQNELQVLITTLEARVAAKTQELQESLSFVEDIINAIPDLLFEIAPDGTYVGVWAQNEEILVAQRATLLGKNFKDILPPDAIETSLRTMREVDEKGHSLGNVYALELPDGTHWFELSVTKKKSTGTYITLSRDITVRKVLEAQLDKERRFLVDAQRVAHTGSWYLDIPNGLLTWSDETYRIFELEKEGIEDLHKTFYEHVHPEDRESVEAPYIESLQTKLPYQVEHRIVTAKGKLKYVIERCENFYDDEGRALYSIGTVLDITERKKAEEHIKELNATLEEKVKERTVQLMQTNIALRESEARYREIFENTSDALYLLEVTPEGRYRNVAFNAAFERSTGIPREALVGRYVDEFGDEESVRASTAKYDRCVAEQIPIEEVAVINVPAGRKTYHSTLIPIKDTSGRVVRIIGLTREG